MLFALAIVVENPEPPSIIHFIKNDTRRGFEAESATLSLEGNALKNINHE